MAASDPYAAGKFSANPYAKKTVIRGSLVVVLDGKMDNRGLELIKPISRCIRTQDVHELILTDETSAKPGSKVDRIAYLGFFEAAQGGVLVSGDEVYVNDEPIGTLAGFDETHMPNHLNIVIYTDHLQTGMESGAQLGMEIRFAMTGKGGD